MMKKQFLVTVEDENISVKENKYGITIWVNVVIVVCVFIVANTLCC